MGFSRQEYWSGLLLPSPGVLPNPGLNPGLPHCRQMLYCLSHREARLENLRSVKHTDGTQGEKRADGPENEALERFSEDKFIQSGAVQLGVGGVPGDDENHQYSRL